MVPERNLVFVDMIDVPRLHQGSCILIFRSLHSLEVVQHLGSPERHPSVILGVLEDAEGS